MREDPMQVKTDNHVHSTFSVDAKDSSEAMARAAITKKPHTVCFTEHIDYNPRDPGYGFFDHTGVDGL
jgi:histidinol-phosphatase (PHP family)